VRARDKQQLACIAFDNHLDQAASYAADEGPLLPVDDGPRAPEIFDDPTRAANTCSMVGRVKNGIFPLRVFGNSEGGVMSETPKLTKLFRSVMADRKFRGGLSGLVSLLALIAKARCFWSLKVS
jgi:hypothetical protein